MAEFYGRYSVNYRARNRPERFRVDFTPGYFSFCAHFKMVANLRLILERKKDNNGFKN